MRYEYQNYDPQYYAQHYSHQLYFNDFKGILQWNGAPQQDALLLQMPVGRDAIAYMRALCARDEELPFPQATEYLRLEKSVSLRYVSAMERSREDGCPINGRGCTYTVFSCQLTEDRQTCRVFAPQEQANNSMNPVSCTVKREIPVLVRRMEEERGILQRFLHPNEAKKIFYHIRFLEREEPYADGDLIYQVENLIYPVMQEMYQSGQFFVRTRERPLVQAKNEGMKVNQRDQ